MKAVRIYILWIDGAFEDVFASYSEATREASLRSHGRTWRIETRERMDY